MSKKKFNIFNYFSFNRDGKGVPKQDDSPRNFVNFFKIFGRNFGRLFTVNLFIVFGNFPVFFALAANAGFFDKPGSAPASKLFAIIHGAALLNGGGSPVASALHGVHGIHAAVSIPTTLTYVFYALAALVIFTFGYVGVGTTYQLRGLVKGDPPFMWHDFWYAIKRNKRQGMIMGIIDVILLALLAFDIVFFYLNIGSFYNNVMFYLSLVIAFVYLVMRFYIYLMMITFDLSFRKLFKNALIFTVLGIKRNIMAVLGIAVLILFNVFMLYAYFPIGIIIPFVMLFAGGAFMAAYAAFPKIKEIMIDPYYVEEEPKDDDRVFIDRG